MLDSVCCKIESLRYSSLYALFSFDYGNTFSFAV